MPIQRVHSVVESYEHYAHRHRNDGANAVILAGVVAVLITFMLFGLSSTYNSGYTSSFITGLVGILLIYIGIKMRKREGSSSSWVIRGIIILIILLIIGSFWMGSQRSVSLSASPAKIEQQKSKGIITCGMTEADIISFMGQPTRNENIPNTNSKTVDYEMPDNLTYRLDYVPSGGSLIILRVFSYPTDLGNVMNNQKLEMQCVKGENGWLRIS